MKLISFSKRGLSDFFYWVEYNPRVARKIAKLIDEITKDPYSGTGKPEPLRHEYSGYWSRRIDKEHRIVYQVNDKAVIIISCKEHYR